MKRCSNYTYSRLVTSLLLCGGLVLVGCESSPASDPLVTDNASQLNDGVSAENTSSLGSAVERLSEVMVSRSETVLANLNAEISVSGVPEPLADCLSSTEFPIMEYFCGSEGQGVRLTDFGYPLLEFRFARNLTCDGAIVNEQSAAACVLEVAEAELEQNWYVRYRHISEQDTSGLTTLQISKGFISSINDPSFASDICIVTLLGSEIVSFNNVAFCDSVLRDVAQIAENS